MSDSSFASALADLFDPPADEWETAGQLAAACDPSDVQTPALALIDEQLRRVADGEINRLIISMPPQEGKSTRTTRWGVHYLMRRHQEWKFAIVSYGADIAEGFSYTLKTDIATFNGEEGNADLGLRVRSDSKAMGRWTLAGHRGGVYAVGIGGALTGRPVDCLVIDDPVKDYRAADSELLSEAAWDWWSSVARPRLAPGAPVIVILTRWHEKDLAGRLIAKQAEDEKAGKTEYDHWTIVNIPAQAENDADPLGREPGEYMISARGRTTEQWEATKTATPPRTWAAMFQGHPSPESGDVWQREWWRRYETLMWSVRPDGTYHTELEELLLSWDMTFKDTKSSDYVVGQVWGRRGADAYLLDQVRSRMTFTETVAAFRAQTRKWPQARIKLVEDKANGTAVMDTLRHEIGAIVPVTPHESKYARASAVAPWLESGNVHVPSARIALFDVAGLVEEATTFPNGAHDDQVDATSQALARLYLGKQQGSAFVSAWRSRAEAEGKVIATTARDWRTARAGA